MDIDPFESVEAEAEEGSGHQRNARLNAAVAVTVAILATFLGICNVKDDNIVQAMQAAQAEKLDLWNFYQARNIREEVANATAEQLKLAAATAAQLKLALAPAESQKPARVPLAARPPGPESQAYDEAIARYTKLASEQGSKKAELKAQAEQAQKTYDALNFRDDQFDLAAAAIAIAIALLAVTALTHLWWLYWLACIPSVFGLVMGVAGLLGLPFHPDFLIQPLT